MLAHYPCIVSSHRISHVPSGDCFAVVLQIELLRTGVERNVGPLSWLGSSNQFPPYVCSRLGNLLSLDENSNIIPFFGQKRNGRHRLKTKPPCPEKGKAADSTLSVSASLS